jgi:hypothetical protein
MPPSVRNRRLGMVSPRCGLGKQSRRIPSDGGQGFYSPFFDTPGYFGLAKNVN